MFYGLVHEEIKLKLGLQHPTVGRTREFLKFRPNLLDYDKPMWLFKTYFYDSIIVHMFSYM